MPIRPDHGLGARFVDADWLAKFEGNEIWTENWLLLVEGLCKQLGLTQENAERLASAMVERAKMPQR